MEERWMTYIDGKAIERIVDVVPFAQFLEPACPCGALCMGQYRFWFDHAGSLHTVDVDRIRLNWALHELMNELPTGKYPSLPRLVRDWSEGVAWCGNDEPFGSETTSEDVFAFAQAIRPHIDESIPRALVELATRADELSAPMRAMTE